MTERRPDDPTLLLHAALDGELDAAGALDVEHRLAADPRLAAEYARLVALRDAIRSRLPRERTPDALRSRVLAMAQAPSEIRPTAPRRSRLLIERYRPLAASLMLGVLLGAGGFHLFARPPADQDVQSDVVAGFTRGRISGQTVDIATSDRHTVKPWFASKIAGATTVVDLKPDGFPLVGGRIDVVGGTPVATLIYQRREHQVALTEIPVSGVGSSSEPRHDSRDGYSLLEWSEGGRLYEAVSDLPPAELDAFGAAFRRAAAAEREDTPKP
jgi:anti-sigma factor RsiW